MKLNEKIQYYRKQSRLSQEALAAQVGVSRQAVSKWELGDAVPEVDKLMALAKAFGVTTDALLSPDPPAPEPPQPERHETGGPSHRRDIGRLDWLIQRYGWLAGVYVALSGLGITFVGGLARYSFGKMYRFAMGTSFSSGWGSTSLPDATSAIRLPLTIATVILVAGLLITVSGVLLAVVLYRKGRKK